MSKRDAKTGCQDGMPRRDAKTGSDGGQKPSLEAFPVRCAAAWTNIMAYPEVGIGIHSSGWHRKWSYPASSGALREAVRVCASPAVCRRRTGGRRGRSLSHARPVSLPGAARASYDVMVDQGRNAVEKPNDMLQGLQGSPMRGKEMGEDENDAKWACITGAKVHESKVHSPGETDKWCRMAGDPKKEKADNDRAAWSSS
ncbi:hypothetical protein LX36DRAFT_39713 [Colletotrichum falcatum]|nr:hypothetical protein LX36DRAFT_39713 [Colletotrichum falcatum]